jgi:oligopeptide/dipeptide ABC transporter ATP-binding protein
MSNPLLEVKNLKAYIHDRHHKKLLRIVDGVSFSVNASEVLGIFGESGSGKSSVAHSIMGLMPDSPGIVGGEIWLQGQNLLAHINDVCELEITPPSLFVVNKNVKAWRKVYEARMRKVRGREIALMPQGAKTALWPFGTIEQQIFKAYSLGNREPEKKHQFVDEILDQLKLKEMAHEYPHQLSGGACQRAIIGMTLALDPTIAIADEPTTGLDTTLQVEIIGLLNRFKRGELTAQSAHKQHALILISHDLNLMQRLADKIVVMYAGEIVESRNSNLIRDRNAEHPYTQKLLDIADLKHHHAKSIGKPPVIADEVPMLLYPSQGCKFYPRCPIRIGRCEKENPKLLTIDSKSGHKVRCHVVTSNRESNPTA